MLVFELEKTAIGSLEKENAADDLGYPQEIVEEQTPTRSAKHCSANVCLMSHSLCYIHHSIQSISTSTFPLRSTLDNSSCTPKSTHQQKLPQP